MTTELPRMTYTVLLQSALVIAEANERRRREWMGYVPPCRSSLSRLLLSLRLRRRGRRLGRPAECRVD